MSILDFTTGLFREPASLQSFVDAPDPVAALPDLDIAELAAGVRGHSQADVPDKSVGEPAGDEVISVGDVECKPIDADDIVDSVKAGKWDLLAEGDKALGGAVDDPLTPEVESDLPAYPEPAAEDLIDPDFSPAAWGARRSNDLRGDR